MIRRQTNAEKITGYLESIYPGWATSAQICNATQIGSARDISQYLVRSAEVECRKGHPHLYRLIK